MLDVVTKVQVVGRRNFGKKKRLDATTALPFFLTSRHKNVS
ncbi:hypothetical protein HMPREF0083_05439, partial [Aneurinibacillus aneurinilyticus ATCC 12856]